MPASLPPQVLAYIRYHHLIQPHDRILVGVSGGPDSTALLHLLHRLGYLWAISLGVVHFDHGLRGAASCADAVWVANLAASLNLPCYLGKDDVRRYRQQKKVSLQTAARHLRLKFFREIQERHEYQALALGHTADDQMELLFLRLLRGAGPEGIKGMWPSDGRGTIRPLLGTSKAQIVHWLKSEGLPFRFDDSNLSRCYRRNQLRLDLLPQLLAYNPRLGEAVTRFQTLLQEQEDFFHQEAARLLSDMRINSGDGSMRLPLAKLLALHPSLQRRVLRLACAQVGVPVETLTFRHLEAALRLCRRLQPAGQISLPGGWRLVRENQQFFWQPRPISLPSFPECLLPDQESGSYTAAGWTFTWTTMPTAGRKELDFNLPHTALMDYHQLHFPLRLRCVRAGDRFRPLGMTGVKKLQDFFVDAKIPRSQRSSIPLLVSGDQIVWVVGHRLADTVKVSDDTRKLFKLEAWLSSPEKISRSNKLPRFDSDVRNDDPSA